MEKTQPSTDEAVPLVFQLREFVTPESDRPSHLGRTQSSCGGEDTYEA
jgi:hypothetical protein